MRLLAVVALVVGLDQLSKYLVSSYLEMGESIPLIHNFLYLTYLRNPGAAFGIFPYQTLFLVVITIVMLVFMIYFYRSLPAGYTMLRFGLSLQLGGAVGNLIDRLPDSYVVDFISLKIWPPVFNLADSAIVIGVVIFLIAFWRLSPSLERCR